MVGDHLLDFPTPSSSSSPSPSHSGVPCSMEGRGKRVRISSKRSIASSAQWTCVEKEMTNTSLTRNFGADGEHLCPAFLYTGLPSLGGIPAVAVGLLSRQHASQSSGGGPGAGVPPSSSTRSTAGGPPPNASPTSSTSGCCARRAAGPGRCAPSGSPARTRAARTGAQMRYFHCGARPRRLLVWRSA